MIEQFLKRKIIPVITIDDSRNAEPVTEALLEGGVSVALLGAKASVSARLKRDFNA